MESQCEEQESAQPDDHSDFRPSRIIMD